MGEEELLEKKRIKGPKVASRPNKNRQFHYFARNADCTLDDFFHQSIYANSITELTNHFLVYLSKFGLDRFVMSELSFEEVPTKEKHHGILVNFPDDWMQHYLENHYIEHDAIYSVAKTARAPFLWHTVKEDPRISAKGKLILEEAKEFKLCDGIGLSIHKPFGEIIGMGLASSCGGVGSDPQMLCEVYAAAHQFYLSFSKLYEKQILKRSVDLSPKEIEFLLWMSRGKTMRDIMEIMRITRNTAKFHCNNIYNKLGVDNSRAAIIMAMRFGYIKPF